MFGDDDIETARSIKLFLDSGFTEDEIAEITRVLGEGMSRLAATTTAAFVRTFLEAGDDEDAVAQRFASMTAQLVPAVKPILIGAFNAHLRDSVRRGYLGRAELEAGQVPQSLEIAVCFADLVGFTRLGGEIEIEELGSVAGGLAAIAGEVVEPPVRLIKTIGDAAMFVSPEPAPLVGVALSLVEAVQAADLPALRAGIAYGPALLRSGDFYGHSVNLASRVTGIARPESVLCTKEVYDAAAEQFEWSFAGRHRLKGITERVPLYRAHPAQTPAEESNHATADGHAVQGSPRHPKTQPQTRAHCSPRSAALYVRPSGYERRLCGAAAGVTPSGMPDTLAPPLPDPAPSLWLTEYGDYSPHRR